MGEFKIKNNNIDIDELELESIDHGMEEIGEDEEGNLIIRTPFTEFGKMNDFIEAKGFELITAETTFVPSTTTELNEEQANEVLDLVDKMEQDEDVQKVYHNLK